MLDRTDHNRLHDARFGLGGNYPPEPMEDDLPEAIEPHEIIQPVKVSQIELTKPTIVELGKLLKDYPVITNETESREAKALLDRVEKAFKDIEAERDGKVRPLNTEVAAINAEYHKVHNVNDKKPGIWDTLVKELKIRLGTYARAEEQRRQAAAEAARRLVEETERKAREAEERERQAAQDAAQGVCDVDFAEATERADTAYAEFQRASRFAARAERDTKVRIVGGGSNAISLKDKETLEVADWKAAIEEMGMTDDIKEAVIKSARAYRKIFEELPPGITASYERSL